MIYSNLGKFVKYGLFRAPYCFVMKKSSYTFLLIALSVALRQWIISKQNRIYQSTSLMCILLSHNCASIAIV